MSPDSLIQGVALDPLLGIVPEMVGGILEKLMPVLLLALILSLLGRLLRSAKVKGRIGEAIVSIRALKRLDPRVYRVFNDLVLPRPDGRGTTQIDHVVVSPFGIFVIETKNYRGWIFGDESSRYWTQVIYGKKSRFQNPLHQNALHLRALAKATELPVHCFHNLIFFVGEAILKTELPPQVMTEGLYSYIRRHQVEALSPEELDRAAAILEVILAKAPQERRRHRTQFAARR